MRTFLILLMTEVAFGFWCHDDPRSKYLTYFDDCADCDVDTCKRSGTGTLPKDSDCLWNYERGRCESGIGKLFCK